MRARKASEQSEDPCLARFVCFELPIVSCGKSDRGDEAFAKEEFNNILTLAKNQRYHRTSGETGVESVCVRGCGYIEEPEDPPPWYFTQLQ